MNGQIQSIGIRVDVPQVFVGMLIGGALPWLFSSFAIQAVTRAASLIVLEKQALADGQETQLTTKLLSDIGQELVANVRYCDTLSSALAQRSQLVMGESLISGDGFWLGRYWLKVLGKSEDSVLARQQRLVASCSRR